ncbi:MAG: beta-ketoacyl-ACP synthase III [Saprospiraceae bacterium]
MNPVRAAISAVNGYVPDYILTNAELEHMVDTNDEWIRSRTGIKERRILKGDMQTSDMGVKIVEGLLAKSNTKPEEIELLICGTITGDRKLPDTANTICDKAGLVNSYGFDINAACSGFLFSLTVGAKFIESGTHKKVIVIGADVMSSIIDYTDRATCVIFGDGAGGVLLEPSTDGTGIQGSILRGDGSGREFLHIKAGGSSQAITPEILAKREHLVYQEGKAVFKNAIRGMVATTTELLAKYDLLPSQMDWVVPHQANLRIITAVADELKIPMENVMTNIERYGNTTAATLPLCLWDYESKLHKGDKIVLTAFGGGFTWGSTYIVWSYDGDDKS